MGDVPTTVNKPAQTVADVISFTIFDVAVSTAEAAALAQIPLLRLPVIKEVFHFLMSKIAGLIYRPLALNAVFTVISIQTEGQKRDYIQAEGNLRAANLTGDPEKIKEATDEFKKTFRRLVHYDGEAHT
jgi:hypothetical protein